MDRLAPQRILFRSPAPEEVEEFWRSVLGTQVTFGRADWGPGHYRLHTASLDGFSTGRQRCSTGLTGDAACDSYMAWVTTQGRSVYQRGREQYASRHGHVGTYWPGVLHQVVDVELGTDLTYLALKSWTLERHLENLLDRPVVGPIRLAPMTRMRPGRGQVWWALLQVFNRLLLDPDSSLAHPAVIDPLCEAMMSSLLLSVDHQYRDALARPVLPAPSRSVRQAIDAIHDHPEQPYTVGSLALLAGVSVRSLQQGFRTHLGTTPMAYLRHVRLARAHDDLLSNDTLTIAEVAHRWGFAHLGRFAAGYAERYGHPPSRTPHHDGEPSAAHGTAHRPSRRGTVPRSPPRLAPRPPAGTMDALPDQGRDG